MARTIVAYASEGLVNINVMTTIMVLVAVIARKGSIKQPSDVV